MNYFRPANCVKPYDNRNMPKPQYTEAFVMGGNTPTANEACPIDATCRGDMEGYPIAMAYVPMQGFSNLYDAYNALENGTLFKDLNLEFRGGRC